MPDEPVHPELEAQIAARPDDLSLRRAYADWLKQADNPRGELAALQLAGDDAAASRFLDVHSKRFFGRGSEDISAISWCGGFWDELEVIEPFDELMTHPSARLLRKLHLDMYGPFDKAVEALASGQWPTLRSLRLGGRWVEGQDVGEMADWTCNNLELLTDRMPRLEQLTLMCGVFRLPSFATLRGFTCDGPSLRVESLHSVLAAELPLLEKLELNIEFMVGETEYPLIGTADFEPLFSGRVFPALRELVVSKLSSTFAKAAESSALAHRANIVLTP